MLIVPLDLLNAGDEGRIVSVDGNDDWVHRLREIGLQEGSRVRIVRSGSPCIVAVDNHRLSFRGEDAAIVMVEVSQHAEVNSTV